MDALSMNMMRIAADNGDTDCCMEIGRILFYGIDTEPDWIRARAYLERTDDRAEAMRIMGIMYQLGLGVRADLSKAFCLYKNASDRGDPEAKYRLGMMYLTGQYVRKNEYLAHKLINESSKAGFIPGTNNM